MACVEDSFQELQFARLTQIAPQEIARHMSDPRMAEHMPLLTAAWSEETARSFVAAKESCWQRDGLGHWAFVCGDTYLGWGGFQKEGADWDFGLVLKPDCFGLGPAIARKALDFARGDPRIPYVTFLLPPSRRHLRPLARLGAEPAGETLCEGQRFLKFHLKTG